MGRKGKDPPVAPAAPPRLRAAIYTRKSTKRGLELEFNSLHNQYEMCEQYIARQNWELVPERYEDPAYSGGNDARPEYQRLLADIELRKIDCVVVYKIDRFSRSLRSFLNVLERFTALDVTFVSVTQQFDTSNAMGRLTLNVLMSFSQYEREIDSERVKDKIAAARRKGRWTNGPPPLGYDLDEKKKLLVVNEREADLVREIDEAYLRHGSIVRIMSDLRASGRPPKVRIKKDGTVGGAKGWTISNIWRVLKNPIYIGKIEHDGELFDGLHPAIISKTLFARVQAKVRSEAPRVRTSRRGYLLRGLLRCGVCDGAMTPSSSRRGKYQYRYYRCSLRDRAGGDACSGKPIPANEIEQSVISQLGSLVTTRPGLLEDLVRSVTMRVAQQQQVLEREARALPQEIERLDGQRAEMVSTVADVPQPARGAVVERVVELTTKVEAARGRLRQVEATLAKLEQATVDAEWIAGILGRFDQVWAEELTTDQRERLLRAVVARVTIHNGSVRMELVRPTITNEETNAAA